MKYTPDQIMQHGLVPYAVYGGYVASFKVPSVSVDQAYDAEILDEIMTCDASKTHEIIATVNPGKVAV